MTRTAAMARRRKDPHPPVVFVEWRDSRPVTSAWQDGTKAVDEAAEYHDEMIVSAGLLLEAGKKYIVLSLGLAPNDDVMHTLLIPRSEVVTLRMLKKPRGMKAQKHRQ